MVEKEAEDKYSLTLKIEWLHISRSPLKLTTPTLALGEISIKLHKWTLCPLFEPYLGWSGGLPSPLEPAPKYKSPSV